MVLNMGEFAAPLPPGTVIAASTPGAVEDGLLVPDACVWILGTAG